MNQRSITRESQMKLGSLLGFDVLGSQDWELECADLNRIGEFLDLYEDQGLNDDERFALMALIVASFDDYLSTNRNDVALASRIRRHLTTHFELHKSTIHYWSLPGESKPETLFSITPFIRQIVGQGA